MKNLTKEELLRVRQVNDMKKVADKNPEIFKLSYFPGGNLMLLQKLGKGWIIKDETGPWWDDTFDYVEIQ